MDDREAELANWIRRLNAIVRDGQDLLRSVEDIAAVVRDATGAECVTVHTFGNENWGPVVSLTGDTHPENDSREPLVTSQRGILHDMVAPSAEAGASEEMGSGLPKPGAMSDRISVPLAHQGAQGWLEISWAEPQPLDDSARAVIEMAAALAALALHTSQLAETTKRRSRLQRAVTKGAGILVSHGDDEEILAKLVDAYTDLVGARLCAIALVDAKNTTITALATRGTSPLEGPIPLREIPESLLGPAERQWAVKPMPIDVGEHPWLRDVAGGGRAGASWYRLVPLIVGRDACGAVVLGFASERRLDPEESLAIDALTGIASAVLERSFQTKRRDHQLRRLDALHRLNTALVRGADAPALVSLINEMVGDRNVEVTSLAFDDRRLARRLHGDTLTEPERNPRFRRGSWEPTGEGQASIPMTTGDTLVGAVRVRFSSLNAPVDAETRTFIADLAHGLAEAGAHEQVRAAVADADRQRTLTNEHQRIAHDLHDSVGQLFVAIRLLAEDHVESLRPGSAIRDHVVRTVRLAAQGKQEIDHAIRGLALVPSSSDGIVGALRKLTVEVATDSGIEIEMRVHGSRSRLDAETERVLFRVAHEALANAWRHAHCHHIEVGLWFTATAVVLRITDDGIGPYGERKHQTATVTEGAGIAGMRQTVERLGGTLNVGPADAHGTLVEVSVPGGRS